MPKKSNAAAIIIAGANQYELADLIAKVDAFKGMGMNGAGVVRSVM